MVNLGYIPRQVKESIQEHIKISVNKCILGYPSAYEKEDTLTGYLFGTLKIREQVVEVENDEVNGTWKWEIDFKTFGGGGKGSSESIIGADGIIELSIQDNYNLRKKSLLFQAKVDWSGVDNRLYKQCQKLYTWLGAAIVVNYTESDFITYEVDTIIQQGGKKPTKGLSLITLLSDDLLNCQIGDSELE